MPGKISNLFMSTLVRSPLHPMLGGSLGIITVQGRKSGRPISTPINLISDDAGWTVTSLRSRTWWCNLRGRRAATLHVKGQDVPVVGEVVEDPARVVAGLSDILEAHPSMARYFQIPMAPDGCPDLGEVERFAGERLLIRLVREG